MAYTVVSVVSQSTVSIELHWLTLENPFMKECHQAQINSDSWRLS